MDRLPRLRPSGIRPPVAAASTTRIGGRVHDMGMRRRSGSRFAAGVVIAIALAVGGLGGLCAPPAPVAAAGLPRWTGGVDLYRSGVFTTQQTWLWCTAADVQIMRNIVDHRRDHSRTAQQQYFNYMRRHDRYAIPVSDGVDPGGWAAGLRHYVDRRYRLVASGSFNAALRSAVRSLRLTRLPVGITVSHGNHAWVLTGFTATADPAVTSHFSVTSVRVVGPLWGLQSRSYGYDMRPDTRLTRSQLKRFFTPWHYAGVHMAWEGDWVSIQPRPTAADRARAATPTPTVKPSPRPSSAAAASPSGSSSPAPSPSVSISPAPSPSVTAAPVTAGDSATAPSAVKSSTSPGALALAAASDAPPGSSPGPQLAGAHGPARPVLVVGLALLIAMIVAAGATGIWAGRRRGRSKPG